MILAKYFDRNQVSISLENFLGTHFALKLTGLKRETSGYEKSFRPMFGPGSQPRKKPKSKSIFLTLQNIQKVLSRNT